MIRNRVVSLRDLIEWTDVDPLPEGATITVEGGQFVLVAPADGDLIDARHSTSVNPDTVDGGTSSTVNADTIDAGAS